MMDIGLITGMSLALILLDANAVIYFYHNTMTNKLEGWKMNYKYTFPHKHDCSVDKNDFMICNCGREDEINFISNLLSLQRREIEESMKNHHETCNDIAQEIEGNKENK